MKRYFILIMLALSLLWSDQPTLAAPNSFQDQALPAGITSESNRDTAPGLPGMGSYLLKVVIILGLLGATVYWFKKRFYGIQPGLPESRLLRVIDKLDLSFNNSLLIVEVGSHYYILGSGSGGVNLLTEITDPELLAELAEIGEQLPHPLAGNPSDFGSQLQKQIERIRNLAGKGGER